MKRYLYSIFILGTVLILWNSCAKEDDPTILYTDPSVYFMPADTATDEISNLRRQFFNETGSYLLFNDTLQHRIIGKDLNGEDVYFTELLDIKYEVGQTIKPSNPYSYTYLNEEKSINAYNYLKKFMLPHFSETLRPYSWLLVSTITGNVNGNNVQSYAVAGQRGVVLACNELRNLKTDNQKQQLANRHLLVVVQNLATKNSASFKEFTDISAKDYNHAFTLEEGQTKNDLLRSKGFLSTINTSQYPSESDDIKAYASLTISYTSEKIEKTYAKYPLVLQKVRLFKEILIKLGYVF